MQGVELSGAMWSEEGEKDIGIQELLEFTIFDVSKKGKFVVVAATNVKNKVGTCTKTVCREAKCMHAWMSGYNDILLLETLDCLTTPVFLCDFQLNQCGMISDGDVCSRKSYVS